jgi:hypothetical protein
LHSEIHHYMVYKNMGPGEFDPPTDLIPYFSRLVVTGLITPLIRNRPVFEASENGDCIDAKINILCDLHCPMEIWDRAFLSIDFLINIARPGQFPAERVIT